MWGVLLFGTPHRRIILTGIKIADFLYDTFGFGSPGTRSENVNNIELKGTCYYYQQLSEYEKEAYESLYRDKGSDPFGGLKRAG